MTSARIPALERWYVDHGRHALPWRDTRDPWRILVSEVMLQQTQVARVLAVWPEFIGRFPTPAAMTEAGVGEVIAAWGRLGYPRRARRLWETATVIATSGWPADLTELPGVGRYTAAAIEAQAYDRDVPAIEVNIRRVTQRVRGRPLGERAAERASIEIGRGLHGRDRLLALMDLGALVCTARAPSCPRCPLRRRCATRGRLPDEVGHRQAPFAGSFRQRRGEVMRALRDRASVPLTDLDDEALASLVRDGLAVIVGEDARLP